MGKEQAQSELREATRVRGGGLESARSGLEPPGSLPGQARFLLSLQQTAGNRAVTGLVQGRFASVQRESAEEEEPLQGRFAPVQRQAAEEEEPLQGRFAPVQRQAAEEEEVQMKRASSPPAQLEAEPARRRNETGLPDGLKSGIESLSGISLDDVRVHYGSARPAQLNALAYAQGSEIHVAPGQEQHLPHEAWHVVQQAQGRVQPTTQLQDGVPINDDEGLEQEADLMGGRALTAPAQRQAAPEEETLLQGKFAPVASRAVGSAGAGVVQREQFIGDEGVHHMHIDIAQPHYKLGNSKASRINIGGAGNQDYRKHDLEAVIEAVKGRLTESGAQACYDWCLGEARRIKAAA